MANVSFISHVTPTFGQQTTTWTGVLLRYDGAVIYEGSATESAQTTDWDGVGLTGTYYQVAFSVADTKITDASAHGNYVTYVLYDDDSPGHIADKQVWAISSESPSCKKIDGTWTPPTGNPPSPAQCTIEEIQKYLYFFARNAKVSNGSVVEYHEYDADLSDLTELGRPAPFFQQDTIESGGVKHLGEMEAGV